MQSELQGSGQLLGYRSMQRKIRKQHQLAAPRNLVYDLMTELDPAGLEQGKSASEACESTGSSSLVLSFPHT